MASKLDLFIIWFVFIDSLGISISQNLRELCVDNTRARYVSADTIRITWSRANSRCGTFVHIRANDSRRRIIRLFRNGRFENEERVLTFRTRTHFLRGVRNASFVYFICSPACNLQFQFNNQRRVTQLPTTTRRTTTTTTATTRKNEKTTAVRITGRPTTTTTPTTTPTTKPTTTTPPFIPPYPTPQPGVPGTVAPQTTTTEGEVVSVEGPRMEGNIEGNNDNQVTWPTTGILIGAIIGISGLLTGGILALLSYRKYKKKGGEKIASTRSYEDLHGREPAVVHAYDQPDVIATLDKRLYQNEKFHTQTGTLPGVYEYAQDPSVFRKKDYISPVYRESESYDDVLHQQKPTSTGSYEELSERTITPSKPYDKLKVVNNLKKKSGI